MMLPFKKGAFHFAIQAGVPIIPIVVANYDRLFSLKKRRFEAGKIKVQGMYPCKPPARQQKATEANPQSWSPFRRLI
jgi:1-acyl-sn-glycerol-3-phosphate acyltransferase